MRQQHCCDWNLALFNDCLFVPFKVTWRAAPTTWQSSGDFHHSTSSSSRARTLGVCRAKEFGRAGAAIGRGEGQPGGVAPVVAGRAERRGRVWVVRVGALVALDLIKLSRCPPHVVCSMHTMIVSTNIYTPFESIMDRCVAAAFLWQPSNHRIQLFRM